MPYIISVLAVIVVGVGFTFFQTNKAQAPKPEPVKITETVPESAATVTLFKDGAYDSKVSYITPIKKEYGLDVSLTIENDVVTDATIIYSQGSETDPNAQRFEGAYKAEVVGKSLDSILLSRVGGASLTTDAFNKALVEIKTQAKS